VFLLETLVLKIIFYISANLEKFEEDGKTLKLGFVNEFRVTDLELPSSSL